MRELGFDRLITWKSIVQEISINLFIAISKTTTMLRLAHNLALASAFLILVSFPNVDGVRFTTRTRGAAASAEKRLSFPSMDGDDDAEVLRPPTTTPECGQDDEPGVDV